MVWWLPSSPCADDLAGECAGLFAPANDPDEQTFCEALSQALGQLPADQRAVVHLKLWEGLTFDEIAGTLDIPPNTAASRYRYGLDKLRDTQRLSAGCNRAQTEHQTL